MVSGAGFQFEKAGCFSGPGSSCAFSNRVVWKPQFPNNPCLKNGKMWIILQDLFNVVAGISATAYYRLRKDIKLPKIPPSKT
jgi:hypothetical protein